MIVIYVFPSLQVEKKSIQVISSGTEYLISIETRIWGTQANLTLLLAFPCAFFHMHSEVLFSKRGKIFTAYSQYQWKTHLSTSGLDLVQTKGGLSEGENHVICSKGEVNQQKHKWDSITWEGGRYDRGKIWKSGNCTYPWQKMASRTLEITYSHEGWEKLLGNVG